MLSIGTVVSFFFGGGDALFVTKDVFLFCNM